MASVSDSPSLRRRELLRSLRRTRTMFARIGDHARSVKVELGIQMLLDQRVSDRMIELLEQGAAVAARDAVAASGA
ncbi:hypothetical protein [Rhizorhabdus dicambivorans]|uniref:Uncharacterized protein n=1 Tax=Rhizorhabdus dicambivorans TaxID=1850238 RepID=A0A2A4FU52_9SPHN|nr:hypothetical protein [Rhizorhabdus dicambivorans]ATE65600.1 hypothetical protein CMV14_15295 [Rhizorhabdus dicambivorans]PCE41943.1 hypothetical protein COO09_13050 [Rhizorhabdus dicambivorans]